MEPVQVPVQVQVPEQVPVQVPEQVPVQVPVQVQVQVQVRDADPDAASVWPAMHRRRVPRRSPMDRGRRVDRRRRRRHRKLSATMRPESMPSGSGPDSSCRTASRRSLADFGADRA